MSSPVYANRILFLFKRGESTFESVQKTSRHIAPPGTEDKENEAVVLCSAIELMGTAYSMIHNERESEKWTSVEQFQCRLSENTNICSKNDSLSQEERDVSAELHHIADSLPYLGGSLYVCLILDKDDIDCQESFIPLVGAFLRLCQWNNAQVKVIMTGGELSPLAEQLCEMTQATMTSDPGDLYLVFPRWTGKVSVMDRVENTGQEFGGFYLEQEDWKALFEKKLALTQRLTEKKKGKILTRIVKRDPNHAVLGRTIEVLQEVNLRTLPWMILDSFVLRLHAFSAQSSPLHSYVDDLTDNGLLCRLRMYPDARNVPTYGDLNIFNTRAWKERIMGDFQDAGEPLEQIVLDEMKFMYFILLPGLVEGSILAKTLISPHEVNKDVVALIQDYKTFNDDCKVNKEYSWESSDLGKLPILEMKEMEFLLNGLADMHTGDLQKESSEDLIQDRISELSDQIRGDTITLEEHMGTVKELGISNSKSEWIQEASLDLKHLPEWKALEAQEASTRKLRSHLSMDSHPAASPLVPFMGDKASSSGHFTIYDVLSILKKDDLLFQCLPGSEKLTGRNLCRVDSQCDLQTPWPDSQSVRFHDIYYYKTEDDMKFERRYARVRDKGYFQDTCSTFASPIKKKKSELLRPFSPVRSSPRRRALLMSRSKSELCQRSSSKQSTPVDGLFKQPMAKPYSKSPKKRVSLSSPRTTPDAHDPYRSKRDSLPSPFTSTPLSSVRNSLSNSQDVRRSPRKHDIRHKSFASREKLLEQRLSSASSSTLSSAAHSSFRRCASSSGASSFSNQTSNLSRSGVTRSPRKRLALSMDFGSDEDGSGMSTSTSSKSLHKSIMSGQRLQEPLVRRSPRKVNMSRGADTERDTPTPERNTRERLSFGDAPSSQETQRASLTDQKQARLKRSERHKMKLQHIIRTALEEKGVGKEHSLHAACLRNVFNVSMVLLKTLPNSQNLKEEMRNVVDSQVQQIINLEKRRCGMES